MQGAGAGDAANNAHVPAGEADLAPAHSASCFPGQIAGDRAHNSPASGTAGAGGDDEVDVGPRVVAAVTGMPSQEEIVRIVAALGDAAEAAEAAAAAASQGEGAAEGGSAETEPAQALGAGEQMQIELVPAWPPAHCSAIQTDGHVAHGDSRPGATRFPSREIC